MDAQADMSLHWAHMSEDTFTDIAASPKYAAARGFGVYYSQDRI